MSDIYVDGFVLPVPASALDQYREMAELASTVWKEHGALDYRETVLDDGDCKDMVSFSKLAGTLEGETVVFAWIAYRSKEHRDEVNAKVMEDERLKGMCGGDVPFDYTRMAYGGFRTIVGE